MNTIPHPDSPQARCSDLVNTSADDARTTLKLMTATLFNVRVVKMALTDSAELGQKTKVKMFTGWLAKADLAKKRGCWYPKSDYVIPPFPRALGQMCPDCKLNCGRTGK